METLGDGDYRPISISNMFVVTVTSWLQFVDYFCAKFGDTFSCNFPHCLIHY